MIDVTRPDFTNTPARESRPAFHYAPRSAGITPYVSIITPYYNAGPVFLETVRCVLRMSYVEWEWIIVDDGSTRAESLAQLEAVRAMDARIRLVRQTNGGPGQARNHGAALARGRYLLQVDTDDLMEPTFVEKALWLLETQPQFAACNSYNVTFGALDLLWPNGFHENELNLRENRMTMQAVIRRDAFLAAGGYDESLRQGHEDWDLWLNLAEAGQWGYTLPEYLTWYRYNRDSRRAETESDKRKVQAFTQMMREKHRHLAHDFPKVARTPATDTHYATITDDFPFTNALEKPARKQRILLVVPWFEIGGSDKFTLDLVRLLTQRGYECTLVATGNSYQPWLHEFAALTPDIFCLERFINYNEYPRFLRYVMDSRDVDAVIITQSEVAYHLIPYLRLNRPEIAILDYTHIEEPGWKNGGYPAMSVRAKAELDLQVTSTQHLKEWMIERGAEAEQIEVCHTNIDSREWDPARYDTAALRARLKIAPETPLILFVGRIVDQKRPLVFAEIIRRLAARNTEFVALVVGTGDRLPALEHVLTRHNLSRFVRLLGAQPNARVRELMVASDVLLLPSASEGLALVLYEAMAMGLVPVAADVGGHAELVTNECGHLIAAGDDEVDDYVDALDGLLRDAPRRATMALAARQRVVEHFDIEQMGDTMEAAIQHARTRAAQRAETGYDQALARHMAHLAVEYWRVAALADWLWTQRENVRQGHIPLKRRLLPYGSRRHEAWKVVRSLLLRAAQAQHGESQAAPAQRLLPAPAITSGGESAPEAEPITVAPHDSASPA